MTCIPFESADGKVTGFVCTRGRGSKKRCCTCQKAGALLLCDGCDRPLCGECAVSPKKDVDFCPKCFQPTWVVWLRACELGHLPAAPGERLARRMAFRQWARANPAFFDCIKRTRASTGARR